MTIALVLLAALALSAVSVALYLVVRQRSLLAEAKVRAGERAELSAQLITAEQDERRRIALFLHDGPVQSMAGIALMLDGATHAIDSGQLDQAKDVMGTALRRHRQTIGELRDLSFNLEPVVLRDQGFGTAARALAEQLGIANEFQIDVDVEHADALPEQVQAGLYQIVREALNGAVRRGPPTRVSIRVATTPDGGTETTIADDAPDERRRASFDAISERARVLGATVRVEGGEDAGTTVHVLLPPYAIGPV